MGSIIEHAINYMKDKMKGNDASHDDLHVFRVRNMALELAKSFSQPMDLEVVELSAILHDVLDHKYTPTDEFDAIIKQLTQTMADAGVERNKVDLVLKIVHNTGFSKEKELRANNKWTEWHQTCLEFHW